MSSSRPSRLPPCLPLARRPGGLAGRRGGGLRTGLPGEGPRHHGRSVRDPGCCSVFLPPTSAHRPGALRRPAIAVHPGSPRRLLRGRRPRARSGAAGAATVRRQAPGWWPTSARAPATPRPGSSPRWAAISCSGPTTGSAGSSCGGPTGPPPAPPSCSTSAPGRAAVSPRTARRGSTSRGCPGPAGSEPASCSRRGRSRREEAAAASLDQRRHRGGHAAAPRPVPRGLVRPVGAGALLQPAPRADPRRPRGLRERAQRPLAGFGPDGRARGS